MKTELWACKSALSSPSYIYYPIECINIAARYKIHPKRWPSLDKAWEKKTVEKNGERCKERLDKQEAMNLHR